MKEKFICALLIIPAAICLGFDFENKKAERILKIISESLLFLLAWYLGIVL